MSSMDGAKLADIKLVINEFDTLLRETKNFNLHINVLKKLLNLKDRQTDLEPNDRSSPTVPLDAKCGSSGGGNSFLQQRKVSMVPRKVEADVEDILTIIKEKMSLLRKEIDQSHMLGFCLAYNVQRLQKRLTGLPIDPNATDTVIDGLWEKHEKTKISEAMLKYEFEEKRKLLRKLRQQLEQTRRDWKAFKIRKPESPSHDEQRLWDQMRSDLAKRNATINARRQQQQLLHRIAYYYHIAVQVSRQREVLNNRSVFCPLLRTQV